MGVFVVGMHRSGTSGLASVLNALGLDSGPESGLLGPDNANPGGYFEVGDLVWLNGRIIRAFDGWWDAPPVLDRGWENRPDADRWVGEARRVFSEVFAGERWFVKDPRVSLLLPLWRRVVLDRCVAVLIVRDPLEVAWSLSLRDGIPIVAGLALWSWYYRSALEGLSGLPVYVCDYGALVEDTVATVGELVRALEGWGELSSDHCGVDEAARVIRPDLRRETWRRNLPESFALPAETSRLADVLSALRGRSEAFQAPAIEPPPWEIALIDERRRRFVDVGQARDARKRESDRFEREVKRFRGRFDGAQVALSASRESGRERTQMLIKANADLAAVRNRVVRLEAALVKDRARFDVAAAKLQAKDAEVSGLRSELVRRDAEVSGLRSELVQGRTRLQVEIKRRGELESALRFHEQRWNRLVQRRSFRIARRVWWLCRPWRWSRSSAS